MLSIVGNTFFFRWEVTLMVWLQSVCGDVGAKIAGIFSFLGEEYALIFIVLLFYLCLDKDLGRRITVNVLTAVVANPLIKNIALRRRPYMDNPSVKCLRPVEPDADINDIAAQGYSFPSGHSMNSAAIYGSVAMGLKKPVFTVLGIVLPLLIGISRVIVGVHYPTDVLVGWAVGVLVMLLMTYVQSKVKTRWKMYAIIAGIALVGFFYCKSDDYFSGYGLMVGFFCGDLFESRFVNFDKPRNVLMGILRMVGGVAAFLVMNKLLKMAVSVIPMDVGGLVYHIARTVRYCLSVFVTVGLYPMLFGIFNKKESSKSA